jgi:transcription elongation factor S-II
VPLTKTTVLILVISSWFASSHVKAIIFNSMHLKDIADLKLKISKALADGNLTSTRLNLEKLRSYDATTDGLRVSKIGFFTNELRKHHNINSEMKELCKELVAKWKRDIGRADTNGEKAVTHISAGSKRDSLPASNPSPTAGSPTNSGSSAPVERTVNGDSLYFSSTRDKVRDKCIEMVYGALASGTTVGMCD